MNYAQNRSATVFFAIGCISAGAMANAYYSRAARAASPPPQDVITLDRRISMLEQRLTMMDSGIRRLEQQSAMTGRTSVADDSAARLTLFRTDLERLHNRIAEIECDITKLDERTLSQNGRERLRRAGPTDPCRLNADTPVQFSGRP